MQSKNVFIRVTHVCAGMNYTLIISEKLSSISSKNKHLSRNYLFLTDFCHVFFVPHHFQCEFRERKHPSSPARFTKQTIEPFQS